MLTPGTGRANPIVRNAVVGGTSVKLFIHLVLFLESIGTPTLCEALRKKERKGEREREQD
jgi:hypothetical protein